MENFVRNPAKNPWEFARISLEIIEEVVGISVFSSLEEDDTDGPWFECCAEVHRPQTVVSAAAQSYYYYYYY
jgi:hypothetical protein